ncbi:MAG: UDP-glucuronate decarboxylase [Ilumatobacteraceae bacterium]|nr:UDP-glucuronate decarboxylase [Ilumatobacteraceae bacterium]
MRVLIAGGAGFIGSHLAEALLDRGDEVIVVDNFISGRPENIAHLDDHDRFLFLEQDVTDPLVIDGQLDVVMDLASPASPNDFATIPLEILAVGSTGTRNLLDLAVIKQARFFLASTSEVYGDPLVHPQPESYWGNVSSISPRSCYDEAKRFSEALAMAYHRVLDADIRIVRIFNTYGPRMRPDDGRVVGNFICQALAGDPITLYGDGTQTRSFCYVDDEVRGFLAVLDGDLIGPINVGNPAEFTMRELAELVVEITGSTSEIITAPLPAEREGDPMQRCPDITLISNAYGWEPVIPLRDGLAKMIDAFRIELKL